MQPCSLQCCAHNVQSQVCIQVVVMCCRSMTYLHEPRSQPQHRCPYIHNSSSQSSLQAVFLARMPSGLHVAALRFSSAFRQLKHQPRAVTPAWCVHREPSLFPQTTFARVLGYACSTSTRSSLSGSGIASGNLECWRVLRARLPLTVHAIRANFAVSKQIKAGCMSRWHST